VTAHYEKSIFVALWIHALLFFLSFYVMQDHIFKMSKYIGYNNISEGVVIRMTLLHVDFIDDLVITRGLASRSLYTVFLV